MTHDSFKGRKQHMYGGKHRNNVIAHYNRVAEDLKKQGHFPAGAPPAQGPGMMPVRTYVPACLHNDVNIGPADGYAVCQSQSADSVDSALCCAALVSELSSE